MLPMIRFYKTLRGRFNLAYGQRDLSMILEQADATTNLEQQVEWLTDLMDWIRLPVIVTKENPKGRIQSARLKFLIGFLESHPEFRDRVADTFQSILIQSKPLEIFCQTGLNQEHGFVREVFDRTFSRALPRHYDLTNLSVLFARVFYLEEDAEWISDIDADTMNALFSLFLADDNSNKVISAKLNKAIADALMILSARVCAVSANQEMRRRLPFESMSESPFL